MSYKSASRRTEVSMATRCAMFDTLVQRCVYRGVLELAHDEELGEWTIGGQRFRTFHNTCYDTPSAGDG